VGPNLACFSCNEFHNSHNDFSFPEKLIIGAVLERSTLDLHSPDIKVLRDAVYWFKGSAPASYNISKDGISFNLCKDVFELGGTRTRQIEELVKKAELLLKEKVKKVCVSLKPKYSRVSAK